MAKLNEKDVAVEVTSAKSDRLIWSRIRAAEKQVAAKYADYAFLRDQWAAQNQVFDTCCPGGAVSTVQEMVLALGGLYEDDWRLKQDKAEEDVQWFEVDTAGVVGLGLLSLDDE